MPAPHLVRHLLQTVQSSDMVQGVYGGRQATVQAEDLGRGVRKSARGRQKSSPPTLTQPQPYLGVDQRCEREVVEQVREVLPHVGVAVFPEAFVVEAVHLRDLPALVVPSQYGDALAVADLQTATANNRDYASSEPSPVLNVAPCRGRSP